jgi:hypothetical protein
VRAFFSWLQTSDSLFQKMLPFDLKQLNYFWSKNFFFIPENTIFAPAFEKTAFTGC